MRVPWRAPTAQPHDHRSKGQPALHAVLADAIQDAGGEVDVQVAEENDAAGILETAGRSEPRPLLRKGTPRPQPISFSPPAPSCPRTSTAATPACNPAERSKFPVRLRYRYLGEEGDMGWEITATRLWGRGRGQENPRRSGRREDVLGPPR